MSAPLVVGSSWLGRPPLPRLTDLRGLRPASVMMWTTFGSASPGGSALLSQPEGGESQGLGPRIPPHSTLTKGLLPNTLPLHDRWKCPRDPRTPWPTVPTLQGQTEDIQHRRSSDPCGRLGIFRLPSFTFCQRERTQLPSRTLSIGTAFTSGCGVLTGAHTPMITSKTKSIRHLNHPM